MVYAEQAALNRKRMGPSESSFSSILLSVSFQIIVPHHLALFLGLFFVWCSPGYLLAKLANRNQNRRGSFFWILAIVAGYHLSTI